MVVRTRLPVSGLLTRVLPTTVTVPPTGMSPVQFRPVAEITIVPELAIWSPVPVASSPTSSLRIPALGVTARIGRATEENGTLIPPRAPGEVGLWSGSAALDASFGEVTIVGHVNWRGMAPFAFGKLAYLRGGDLVVTSDAHGAQTAWRVLRVFARAKTGGVDPRAFAGPRGPRQLVLITCGGAFDVRLGSYSDNVYVRAVPA